jgi:hypothetical protein
MDDKKALEALFNAAGGNSWKCNTGWMTSAQLGEWKGVKVNGAGRVIELHLNWNNLKGQIDDVYAFN